MDYDIITIEGATGSGKSDLALTLAKQLDTEIISADSRQVYKYLNIGTAKPDSQTLAEVRHHLIDIITPDQRYSAGAFVKDALPIIKSLHQRGKIPIVCGGTMLYIKSLLYGLDEIPEIPAEAKLKASDYMTTHTLAQCYDFVREIDERFARQISPNDRQRISRAIEVWMAFKKPLTAFWDDTTQPPYPPLRQAQGGQQNPPTPLMKGGIDENLAKGGFKPYKILVSRHRDELYHRINTRMTAMIKAGLLEEIKAILAMGYTKDDYGLNSVSYKEFLSPCADPIEKATQHTRNYAKRQLTWYRKQHFDFIYTGTGELPLSL